MRREGGGMANFTVSRAYPLVVEKPRGYPARVVTRTTKTDLWARCAERGDIGVYVFSMRRPRGKVPMPYYVGITVEQSFEKEVFESHKARKYLAAMLLRPKDTPMLTFLPLTSRRTKRNRRDIHGLETLLIWLARARNDELLNERKIDTAPHSLMKLIVKNTITGVLNAGSGRRSKKAAALRSLLALR
jgi:hypothetical protein